MIAAYRHPPEADLSPDGQRAAFNDDDWYLRIVFTGGGKTTRLAWHDLIPRRVRLAAPPRWSPDGEWLAVAYLADEAAYLGRIHVARRHA